MTLEIIIKRIFLLSIRKSLVKFHFALAVFVNSSLIFAFCLTEF